MKSFANIRLLLISAVNLLWAIAFTWLLVSGVYAMYISKKLWPLIAAGAILSLLTSVLLMLSSKMKERRNESSTELITAGIMLVPLFYFVTYQGDTLGSFALEKRTVCMVEQLPLLEITGLSQDTVETDLNEMSKDYISCAGKTVSVEGAFYNTEGIPVLYRFLIVCCLNDAVPRAVFIQTESVYDTDQWMRVTGKADTVRIDGNLYPCLTDVSVELLPSPGLPYLYP